MSRRGVASAVRLRASAALVTAMLLGGCFANEGTSGSTAPATPSGDPSAAEKRTDITRQQLFANPGVLVSNLPKRLGRLPLEATRDVLKHPLAEPAVMAAAVIDEEAEATQFSDQNVYLVGASGATRSLNLGDLGLPASEWIGADGSGLGSLSPDGRRWAIGTQTQLVVVDLSRGVVHRIVPEGVDRPASPSWSGANTLVVSSLTDLRGTYLVDAAKGSSARIPVPRYKLQMIGADAWLVGRSGGNPVMTPAGASEVTADEMQIPFRWKDPRPGVNRKSLVAFFVDSLGDTGDLSGSRVEIVLVREQELEHDASLRWPRRQASDALYGWVEESILLLRQGSRLCAWSPTPRNLACTGRYSQKLAISVALDEVVIGAPASP